MCCYSFQAASSRRRLHQLQPRTVFIPCQEELVDSDISNTNIPTVGYMHVPVSDDPESRLCDYFDTVADKIQHVSDEDGRVLLHCNAGVSRSATLCLAYLMKHRRLTLAEAHALLKSLRPIVRPNSGFWRQLIEYERKLHGKNTVSMINSPVGHIPDLYERETRGLIPL
ncbi:hypothetical protein G5714_006278 [Onychostoma macrolepis]|uniref:Protein-tyrosine-phosphatase n=1 Tax=Onychostoma macrolepis TaxID=369639 RepID=A0A7J6D3E2_9TELE|nr:hypothetical protein G5714_006278 [Onychostoma macrolepis]